MQTIRVKPTISRSVSAQRPVAVVPRAFPADTSGIAFAGSVLAAPVLIGLWYTTKQKAELLAAELEQRKAALAARDEELKALKAEVEKVWRPTQERVKFLEKRLDEAAKDQLKLERALEMKDGQLESFMTVATRQIKMLEERAAELQAWDAPVTVSARNNQN